MSAEFSLEIEQKPAMTLVDTTKVRDKEQRTDEYTAEYLLRVDPSGKKLNTHVLFLESRLEARDRLGTDANMQTLLLCAEFYAKGGVDAGVRARSAIAAVTARPEVAAQDTADIKAAHGIKGTKNCTFEEALREVQQARVAPVAEVVDDEWANCFEDIE
jgi:hypothetical protein